MVINVIAGELTQVGPKYLPDPSLLVNSPFVCPDKRPTEGLTVDESCRLIREAGRVPVQRDSLYHELQRFDAVA